MAKFCSNCGAQIPEGSIFCGECGTRVTVEETPAAPVTVEAVPEAPVYSEPAPEVYSAAPEPVPGPQPVYNPEPVAAAPFEAAPAAPFTAAAPAPAPAAPFTAAAPAPAPAAPVAPVSPLAPAAPAAPGVPMVPAEPDSPAEPEAPAADDSNDDVASTGAFFWLGFAYKVPILGFILCIVMAAVLKNKNLRHHACAQLIWVLTALIILIILVVIGAVVMNQNGLNIKDVWENLLTIFQK